MKAWVVQDLDMDPSNNVWWNLLALCQRCHLHIQGKVVLERGWFLEHSDWFKPYVAGYYASIKNLPTDRNWVMKHIEILLEFAKGLKYGNCENFKR